MPFVTVTTSDAHGIRTATAVRVEDEQEANDYVYDALCVVAKGDTGALLNLFGGWLDTMHYPCICGQDCPRTVEIMLPEGEAMFSYFENSPFIL